MSAQNPERLSLVRFDRSVSTSKPSYQQPSFRTSVKLSSETALHGNQDVVESRTGTISYSPISDDTSKQNLQHSDALNQWTQNFQSSALVKSSTQEDGQNFDATL